MMILSRRVDVSQPLWIALPATLLKAAEMSASGGIENNSIYLEQERSLLLHCTRKGQSPSFGDTTKLWSNKMKILEMSTSNLRLKNVTETLAILRLVNRSPISVVFSPFASRMIRGNTHTLHVWYILYILDSIFWPSGQHLGERR